MTTFTTYTRLIKRGMTGADVRSAKTDYIIWVFTTSKLRK